MGIKSPNIWHYPESSHCLLSMNRSKASTRLLLLVAALFFLVVILVVGNRVLRTTDESEAEIEQRYPSDRSSLRQLLGSDSKTAQGSRASDNQTDYEEILNRAYSELEGIKRQEVILNNLRKLTKHDPQRAVKWVLEMAPDETQNMAMAMVFTEWAQHDPENAASWIMQNLSMPLQLRAIAATSLATSWVGHQPNKAMQWSDHYFDRTKDYNPFQDAIIVWAKNDVKAVAQHITNVPYDDATGYIAMIDFVNIYSQEDLDRAREWVRVNVPNELQAAAQVEIIEELTKRKPSEATEHLLQADNLIHFESNLQALLSQWAGTDIVAASKWVDSNLNNAQKEMAYEQLTSILRIDRPQLAIEYARALSDTESRTEITTDILTDWRDQNRSVADKWISENIDSIDRSILEEVGYLGAESAKP